MADSATTYERIRVRPEDGTKRTPLMMDNHYGRLVEAQDNGSKEHST